MCELSLKYFWKKKLENIFQSLIGTFLFLKIWSKKKIRQLITTLNKVEREVLVHLLTLYEMDSAFDCVTYNLLFLVFILLSIKLLISFIYYLFLFCDLTVRYLENICYLICLSNFFFWWIRWDIILTSSIQRNTL